MSTVFNGQDNESDKNKLPKLDSTTDNRNPHLQMTKSQKKCVGIELDKRLFPDLIKHYKTV